MAGIEQFWDYQDKYSSTVFNLWDSKNQLDILKSTDFNDRVAQYFDWKNEIVIPDLTTNFNQAMNANDDHQDNTGFFTQTQRYNAWNDYQQNELVVCAAGGEIACDNRFYDNWQELHEDIIFYDTVPCMRGPFIGQANAVRYDNKDLSYTGFYTNTDTNPLRRQYDANGVLQGNTREGWDMDLRVASGQIRLNNDDLYKDYLEDWVDLIDDCDIDCQKNGSQMTIMALLMSVCYGLIGLNSIFAFAGTWNYGFRVCSTYFTLCMCLFQLAIQIAVATMLFTNYNRMCMRSLYPTWQDIYWTMSDDITTFTSMWISSWFLMCCFAACGLCGAMKKKTVK